MSEPARNRFALDLDDLERQLRGAAQAPKSGQPVDPLVELTRIVGRDDPLKELFAPKVVGGSAASVRSEPSFGPAHPEAPGVGQPPMEVRGALDEFEALLRRNDGAKLGPVSGAPGGDLSAMHDAPIQAYRIDGDEPMQSSVADARDLDQEADYHAPAYQAAPAMYDDEMPDLQPRRSRKGLWTVAALFAVGVLGAGAAVTWKKSGASATGAPPTIAADKTQIKVQPANPGGTEIPDQNKQIYERATDAPAAPSKVVTREEQPIDVQQAARTMSPRVVLAGPGSGPATPDSGTNALSQAPAVATQSNGAAEPGTGVGPAVPGLGEPRRVRTVSIRPDGTPAPAGTPNLASTAGSTNSIGSISTGSAAPTRVVQTVPVNPATTTGAGTTAQRPRAATATPEVAKVPDRTTAPVQAPPMRIASAGPLAAASEPSTATAAIRAGAGDFTVQLGAPGSESEARATFSALQRKYPGQLGGQAPIVRKTELAGGKTVFRLRVGPYSREDATTVCTQLQAAGGQCFIAKN